mmetsp:Transcript_28859/g.60603  ORF Transcript_28859/g.60603 Transcript_28859/m.60603 type:complete len:490 (-) Transcript_28859:527-1996(-)|eukprot:CAMPEP_0172213048 /NCGR_PEP_ID=MMETSP1050-20130122/37371_1 /TAXON_ID=233186 /ORGANISM="Cryptomonas curvata, Strain CCAP979/52" /LENGTH=489 /DNA_ID=CAMNT_0012893827 /DNA_START=274 /DNA_END=1743 /DNA_ORIENTATION=+
MADEIQFMHEELTNLSNEIQSGIDELKKNAKRFSPDVRNEKVAYLQDRVNRSKDVLASFRVELREVLKEAGRATYSDYEAKGKVHNANVNKLATDLETFRVAEEKKELLKGAKAKKGVEEEKGGNATIEKAKEVQHQTAAALGRGAQLVQKMEEVGLETNLHLKSQTEQMKNTNADVEKVDAGIAAAQKAVKDIARKMASDKMIMCLLLVLVALIVAIIVIKSVDPSILGQSNDPCSLLNMNAAQTVQQCMTKYVVNIQLLFDKSVVNAANYIPDYKKNTESSLLKYTGALAVTTASTIGRRDIALFRVLAQLEVRGENVAKALTQKLKNTTDVISGLNLPGLKDLTKPYYCLEGKCTAPTTQTTQPTAQVTPSPSGGSSDNPAGNPKGTTPSPSISLPTNDTNTTTWADNYVTTSANFSTEIFPTEAVNDTSVYGTTPSDNSTDGNFTRRLLWKKAASQPPISEGRSFKRIKKESRISIAQYNQRNVQ